MEKLYIFLLIFLLVNIVLDLSTKRYFHKNTFPENIVVDMKEDIEVPYVEEEQDIPKIIYRTYKKDKISKFQDVLDKTEKITGYEQVIYDDEEIEDFIKKHYPERILKAYKSINPEYGAVKADFFRYLLIYIKGGIYMDIKSGPVKNFNDIIEKEKGKLIVSYGTPYPNILPLFHIKRFFNLTDDWSYFTGTSRSEIVQWFFISPKGNPILKETIKQVVSNIEEGLKNPNLYSHGRFSVVALAGPICFSKVVLRNKNSNKVKFYHSRLNQKLRHSISKDYVKVMGKEKYEQIKNKNVLLTN